MLFCSLPLQTCHRWTRICGTKGELRWDGSARNAIEVHDFATGQKRLVYPDSIGRWSSDVHAWTFNHYNHLSILVDGMITN